MKSCFFTLFSLCFITLNAQVDPSLSDSLVINEQEYLEMCGVNVMLAHDFYPESHQGGVGIIQNGIRVATNGDLRLKPAPGQWQPVPKQRNFNLLRSGRAGTRIKPGSLARRGRL